MSLERLTKFLGRPCNKCLSFLFAQKQHHQVGVGGEGVLSLSHAHLKCFRFCEKTVFQAVMPRTGRFRWPKVRSCIGLPFFLSLFVCHYYQAPKFRPQLRVSEHVVSSCSVLQALPMYQDHTVDLSANCACLSHAVVKGLRVFDAKQWHLVEEREGGVIYWMFQSGFLKAKRVTHREPCNQWTTGMVHSVSFP